MPFVVTPIMADSSGRSVDSQGRGLAGWTRLVGWLFAWAILVGMIAEVVAPTFRDLHLLAGHDWDEMEGYRYLVVKTIRRYHQFPFWNPYTCGGHPLWGGLESDTTIVSPYLSAYLFLPLPVAMRIELVGNALISVVGAWLLAGRFARSPAARTFAVAVFSVNGRWALQAAAGHTWHYVYEWTPWTLFFLDRAYAAVLRERRPRTLPWRDIAGAGASLAMMVYMGGIYPLPQTIVVVAIDALAYAWIVADGRPVLCAIAAGLASFALSAPKLLPTLEVFARFPRYVDSKETMTFDLLAAILTSRDQDFNSRPAPLPAYGWHEWGMYIGTAALAVILAAAVYARGPRVRALKYTTLVVVVLALGAFHPYAPWTVLHGWSLFQSQHVPARWLFPAALLAGVLGASAIDRAMIRAGRWRPITEFAALFAVAAVAYDIASVARLPLAHAFERLPPRAVESLAEFHTEIHRPEEIGYPTGGDWSPNTLPNVLANVGMTDCGSFFQFHNFYRDHNNHAPGLGARGRGDPDYRGEVFVAEGRGTATIARWTPNEVTVDVTGARPGDHLLLNQNWDAGWSANGRAVLDWADLPAATLRSGHERVVFRYFPGLTWLGLALLFAAVAAFVAIERRTGRRARLDGDVRAAVVHGAAASLSR